jgi:hypothetical protein
MDVKHYFVLTAWALLLVPRLATAQGNLVFNGGFDSNANGWIISNAPNGFGYSSVGGHPGGDVLLDNIAPSPSSDPTASQTISSLIPGITYVVSGDYQQEKDRGGDSPTNPSFGVAIDSLPMFTAVAPNNFNWQQFSFSYTATSSSIVLSLSSQINGTGVSYAIDNIAMQAVPEPGILSLSLFSICILVICWRIKAEYQFTGADADCAFGSAFAVDRFSGAAQFLTKRTL